MPENENSKTYVDINIGLIEKIDGNLPFDIYLKRGDSHYTKLFPKNEEVDRERIRQYKQQKGVQEFSVQEVDYVQYTAYVEKIATHAFRPETTTTADEAASVLGEMINATVVDLVISKKLDENDIRSAGIAVQGCIKLLSQDPKKFVDILKLLARQPYALKHSIFVAVLSISLARMSNLGSDKSLMMIGLGALLHDIGMSLLPYEMEEFELMTATQLREIKEHPQLGKKILDGIRTIPSEVSQIVLQHHEQPNGMGYPNRLGGTQIFMPAKVVAIADAFALMTVKCPGLPEPLSSVQAIQRMKDDINRFDTNLLHTFSSIFIRVRT